MRPCCWNIYLQRILSFDHYFENDILTKVKFCHPFCLTKCLKDWAIKHFQSIIINHPVEWGNISYIWPKCRYLLYFFIFQILYFVWGPLHQLLIQTRSPGAVQQPIKLLPAVLSLIYTYKAIKICSFVGLYVPPPPSSLFVYTSPSLRLFVCTSPPSNLFARWYVCSPLIWHGWASKPAAGARIWKPVGPYVILH